MAESELKRLEAEYELIQQKKSKLSANKRRWVVRQVEADRREDRG